MIEKPGRKALFTGPVAPGMTGQEQGAVIVPRAIEAAIQAVLAGDDAAQIGRGSCRERVYDDV